MKALSVSEQVRALLGRAAEDARQRRHGPVTVAHAVRALVAERDGARLLQAIGADPLDLIDGLERHLAALPKRRWFQPAGGPDAALLTLCERAAVQVMSSGRQELRPGDLLAALFRAPAGPALRLLEAQGVTRLDLLRYLCHGLTRAEVVARAARRPPGDGDSEAPTRVVLLNDDYTTMEFVIMVLQSVFDHPEDEARRLMAAVHGEGRGVAGTFPAAIAAIKAADVLELSTGAEFPLLCALEPA